MTIARLDTAPTGRAYAGQSLDERRAARRGRLLEAGLELFGSASGWPTASIERLCVQAGVATRSFYEEFSSREELLLAVYELVLAETTAALTSALVPGPPTPTDRVEQGVRAYVESLTADPRRARVAHTAVRAAGARLESYRRAAVVGFAALIEREADAMRASGAQRPDAGALTALALAGAVNELLVDWAATDPVAPTEPLIAELTRVFLAVLQ